ncbi:dethiobiotin synthase [Acerihabitans arboris]|uniref:ATP-dependent dethiobiotin synthetase BioD n=1 Tax=Acerihabitans arboris TaxID=2691583 RepID=A0A845SDE0_9GAMM|nr:dethiobiotin synthase [Acerihabitans arboris]NDL62800.1 ATP-dependent dethiobiotin synthetase BioD [Acerihabitans arboris]
MAKQHFFITGTDTDIGKTLATCALLQAAKLAGWRAVGYKPVAAGCRRTLAGARNDDALALIASSGVGVSYEQVNPLAFLAATSPHIACRDEGRHIDPAVMSRGLAVLARQAQWVFIEGAGGWFTPLGDTLGFDQWVAGERLPVILVVGLKLGCINHALLTALAIRQAGLPLAGWIANDLSPEPHRRGDYLAALRQRLGAPLLGEIPWLADPGTATLAHYIDLGPLARAIGWGDGVNGDG